jgi:orotidine-5'-phosphate decarboxylase
MNRIVVALDVPHPSHIAAVMNRLPPSLDFFKVGLELFCAGGPSTLIPLKDRGMRIFLDLKLHDIPRTVSRAATAAAAHGIDLLTVHAAGGRSMLADAANAAHQASQGRTKVLAITALTSLSENDLRDTGVAGSMPDQVKRLAELAVASGVDGVVCSPLEAALLRAALGPAPLLVTPGVRARGDALGDQQRVASAGDAIRAGASLLVVGRPILEAADPRAAAEAIAREVNEALAQ